MKEPKIIKIMKFKKKLKSDINCKKLSGECIYYQTQIASNRQNL